MPAVDVCPYDGTPIVREEFDPFVHGALGRVRGPLPEDACPTCAADIAEHNRRCTACRQMCEEMENRP